MEIQLLAVIIQPVEQLFNNPNWTFIINFVGIFLGIISILFSLTNPFKRELHLIYFSNWTKHENIDGKPDLVRQVHKIELTLQNISKDILLREYIVDSILIDLSKSNKIEKLAFETNCEYNSITADLKNNII